MSQKRYRYDTKKKRKVNESVTRKVRKVRKTTKGKSTLMPLILIVMSMVLGVSVLVYAFRSGRINHHVIAGVTKVKTWVIAKKTQPTAVKNKKQTPLPEEEPIQFEFYSTLANSDEIVKIDPNDEKIQTMVKDRKKT